MQRVGIALQFIFVVAIPDEQKTQARSGQEVRRFENRFKLVPAAMRPDVGADEVRARVERVVGRNRWTHIEHPIVHAVGDEEHVGWQLSFGNDAGSEAFRQCDDLDGLPIKQSFEPFGHAEEPSRLQRAGRDRRFRPQVSHLEVERAALQGADQVTGKPCRQWGRGGVDEIDMTNPHPSDGRHDRERQKIDDAPAEAAPNLVVSANPNHRDPVVRRHARGSRQRFVIQVARQHRHPMTSRRPLTGELVRPRAARFVGMVKVLNDIENV